MKFEKWIYISLYRLGNLRERYEYLLTTFQAQLQSPLSQRSADKNGDDRKFTKQHINQNDKAVEPKFLLSLKEHFEWIDKKSVW